jgi:hypothetical protein
MSDFLDNKYTRWYRAIVEHRRMNVLDDSVYSESHHIVPESFYRVRSREGPAGWLDGDPEAPENKVTLTGREHGLAHWLLTKMTTGVALIKCQQAFDMMGVESISQGRTMTRMITRAYERNRIEVARIRSERMIENNPMSDAQSRARVGDAKRGVPRGEFSKEWTDAMSAAKKGEKNNMWGKNHKQSTIEILSHLASLRTYSKETNDKRRTASSGRKEITDGTVYKKVKLDELQSWLDKGWIVQGKPRKKKQK